MHKADNIDRADEIIRGVAEAIQYIQDNWINERSPTWNGDIHEFMANVITEDVTIFEVIHLLTALSKGEPIEGIEDVYAQPQRGTIASVQIRRKVLTPQEKNP